jgi:cytochrome c oxidase cbb3-type subunit III
MKPSMIACSALFLAAPMFAQHTFGQADIDDGARLFRANCVICHGPDGDKVSGVDLGHGKFRRATTNEDVENIIIGGIPGTAMPPHNFTEREAFTIVIYLRKMAELAADSSTNGGDPARGQAVFEGKGGCTACHNVLGKGSRIGPNLSDIGLVRRGAEILRSIVDPDAEIHLSNRTVRATTKGGEEITGRLLNSDTFSVQILDSKERLRTLQRADLRQYAIADKSPMPSYKGKLTDAELTDVVAYLSSLKGAEAK